MMNNVLMRRTVELTMQASKYYFVVRVHNQGMIVQDDIVRLSRWQDR